MSSSWRRWAPVALGSAALPLAQSQVLTVRGVAPEDQVGLLPSFFFFWGGLGGWD